MSSAEAKSGVVTVLTDGTLDDFVRGHPAVFVDCWAAWCGPCRQVAPIVEAMAGEQGRDVSFAKLNTDENRATTQRFRIFTIPMFLVFRAGALAATFVGAKGKEGMEATLHACLDGAAPRAQSETSLFAVSYRALLREPTGASLPILEPIQSAAKDPTTGNPVTFYLVDTAKMTDEEWRLAWGRARRRYADRLSEDGFEAWRSSVSASGLPLVSGGVDLVMAATPD